MTTWIYKMIKDGRLISIWIALAYGFLHLSFVDAQAFGSCNFEGQNWLCNYQQATDDNFDWQYQEDGNGGNYMMVDTQRHAVGATAKLTSPSVKQQDTHCFSFDYHLEDLSMRSDMNDTTTFASTLPGKLHVYVADEETGVMKQPVWVSSDIKQSGWHTVYLALNPRAYQVIFEAVIVQALPGIIAIDNIKVSASACVHAPYFLRLGDKEVNAGHNQTLQCLLWGYGRSGSIVNLQKSTGDLKMPMVVQEHGDHMSAMFGFVKVTKQDSGMYRCLSRNQTTVGVSNYASLSVRVPPTPRRGPKVVRPGATNLVIQLNADEFAGDGPVVQKILKYRSLKGDWSDVHHITTPDYHLWNLQPDTEYELTVTLVRSGPGGAGPPGPTLVQKTKCGVPVRPVQNVLFERISHDQLKIMWDLPDFSVTQCHHFTNTVKYRKYANDSSNPAVQTYMSRRVQNQNTVILRGLEAFTRYVVKVELSNIVGSKETGDYTVQTGEAVPEPVPLSSFVVTHVNESSVSLEWDRPNNTNGILKGYEVSYSAQSSSDPNYKTHNDKGLLQLDPKDRHLQISLHPGTRYLIGVKAKTSAGYGPAIQINTSTPIAAPTMPQYPAVSNSSVTTPTTIEITIIPADANGAPVTNYFVIIEGVTPQSSIEKSSSQKKKNSGKAKGRRRNRGRAGRDLAHVLEWLVRFKRQAMVDVPEDLPNACKLPPVTYETAKARNSSVYAGARFSPDDLKEERKFVVGDNVAHSGFSNPPLDPNKDYNIYVRAESTIDGETKVSCVLAAIKMRFTPTTAPFPPTQDEDIQDTSAQDDKDGEGQRTVIVVNGGDSDERNAKEDDDVMWYAAISGAVIGALLIAIAVIIFIMKFKRKRKFVRQEEVVNPFEVHMMMSDVSTPAHTFLPSNHSQSNEHERQHLMPDLVGYDHQDGTEKGSLNGGTTYGGASNDERFAVRVDDLHVHVSQMKAENGYGFREEFSSLPDGSTAPCTVADASLNKSKNRYGNVKAYDHSRVVLDPAPGFEEEYQSDYINASYIDGYKNPNMYIAAQAPTLETLNDFWWMIWQEKCHVIVMVTKLVELGKIKSEKYWPDDRDTYGSVQVSLTGEERTADYTVRSFVLQQVGGYDARDVKQFHFTSWPDHGVPPRPTSVLSFVRRVKSFEHPEQGPAVVHCSAGSGRTGCYIVIDMMLDMARDEELVDIHNTVRDLRTKRINMVQTEEQYVFIHEAVLEAVVCGETSVNADDLVQHYDDLITVDPQSHFAPIQEEFETLNVLTPKLKDEECSVSRLPRNRAKNRFMDVLPADVHLAYLVTPDPDDRENNYVNAVFVDSYSAKSHFLVTQMPLPSTVMDIWRLIYDYKCNSVVMMNDQSEHDENCAPYWPEHGVSSYGPFTVELLTKDDEVDVITRLFKLQNTARPNEDYRLVQQFQLTNWPGSQPVPYARNSVLRVVQLTNNWQNERAQSGEQGRALVHCVAGAGRSGTFVACYNMCEQMRQEYSVDVFNLVQRLRNIRPQFVETLEQYRFCYEVGIEFADH